MFACQLLTCAICWGSSDPCRVMERNRVSLSQTATNSGKLSISSTPHPLPLPLFSALLSSARCSSSRWGSVRREESSLHRPWTHIWTSNITCRAAPNQPSLADISTNACTSDQWKKTYWKCIQILKVIMALNNNECHYMRWIGCSKIDDTKVKNNPRQTMLRSPVVLW